MFISRRKIEKRRKLVRAIAPWSLDSGGFSEITMFGEWRTSPAKYIRVARRARDEIGLMRWAAPQDWMCEPPMLKRTGLSIAEHQRRTIANYLELKDHAPDVPWIPVLQGWRERDYFEHVEQYARARVDLAREPIVGMGTVCRRQASGGAGHVLSRLAAAGIRIHAFGFKTRGVLECAHVLASADSHAWAMTAHYRNPMPGHTHRRCKNCLIYALAWRDHVLNMIAEGKTRTQQMVLEL